METHAHSECCKSVKPLSSSDGTVSGYKQIQQRVFQIEGMCCVEEVSTLKRVLGRPVGGEGNLSFDVLNRTMTIFASIDEVADKTVITLVSKTGMKASLSGEGKSTDQVDRIQKKQKLFALLSSLAWLSGLLWHIAGSDVDQGWQIFAGHGEQSMPIVEQLLFNFAIIFGTFLIIPKAFYALKTLRPDMNLLMVVAIIGAIALGELFEAATVAFLFIVSLMLEGWSVGRARDAVASLLKLTPEIVRIQHNDGREVDVASSSVSPGTKFIIHPGDRIALDGIVVEGIGSVDQSPVTGESQPVLKQPGEIVFAGTINSEGVLIVKSNKRANETVLARIVDMVGQAHTKRAPAEKWVEKFAKIYTPIVMLVALIVAAIPPLVTDQTFDSSIYNALVLLVIACPCALVISTPVSIVAALASAARNGVLIKGGAYIEMPGRLKALALDKTGTLTFGKPKLFEILCEEAEGEEEILSIAASLEIRSTHPVALAVLNAASERELECKPAREIINLPGRGLKGCINGQSVWAGSVRLAKEMGVDQKKIEMALSKSGHSEMTAICVGQEKMLHGIILVNDVMRPEVPGVIADLKSLGVKNITMLTGDNELTANAIAKQAGLTQVKSGLLPADKVAHIEAFANKNEIVAMVGDGINDAPAMARANFGIAMGVAGSDTAIETADIALMTDDLSKLPWLIRHSRRTLGIIHQNIVAALGVKAVFAVLTLSGIASLWGAIFADVGMSLLVVMNALRLLRT